MESKALLAPIYRWGIQDIERLSNFPKVTELVRGFSKQNSWPYDTTSKYQEYKSLLDSKLWKMYLFNSF